jgi:hypothetical protein
LLQRSAREAQKGIWALQPGVIVVYITKTGNKYHLDGCKYLSGNKIRFTSHIVQIKLEDVQTNMEA